MTRKKHHRIPTPPHPLHRRKKLPWQQPKRAEEDAEAPARVRELMASPSYRQADEDVDFLQRDETRGVRCPPWRAKRRRVVPGSREATRDTRRAEGAKGDPKGASERDVQSYGRPVCSRNELAMLWRNAG